MTIQEYFGDWSKVIDTSEADKIIRRLSSSEIMVCPQLNNIFKAFRLCPLEKLRVILVGQDPYPTLKPSSVSGNTIATIPVATGLAFANSPETPESSYSPSLEVLKESVINYAIPHRITNFDPSLEKWERQGVLLLNTALSCLAGRAGSHILMWRPFMKSLFTRLSTYTAGVVYVLMGSQAQSMEAFINRKSNYIIRIRHPSWYARTNTRMPSEVWNEINNILVHQNGTGIQWYEEY